MKQILEGLKTWMDILGMTTGTALALYGILIGGILNMILIGITSIIIGYGIRLILWSMEKRMTMAKTLKQGEIYKYPKGTKVKIKDSVQCHQRYHDGGTLIFQDRNKVDNGEYRVGIQTEFGVCFDFHPDEYELIKK